MHSRLAKAAALSVAVLLLVPMTAFASTCTPSANTACPQAVQPSKTTDTATTGATVYHGLGEHATVPSLVASAQSALLNRIAPVPEPGTLTLLGTGLIGLARIVRRRFRS